MTDAYYAAFTLPDLMSYFLVGGVLSVTFVPLFSDHIERGDEAGGWRLFSTIATIIGALMIGATVAAEALAPQLVGALFSELAPSTRAATVRMTRILLPAQIFFYLGGLLAATLMARGRFKVVALTPLVYNACIILGGVALGPWMGMEGFAVGALAGAILGPFGLTLWATRREVKFWPNMDWRSPGFRRFIALSAPLMLGASLVSADAWLLQILGGRLDEGTISALNYGRRLMMVPIAVLAQAVGQAALPFMAQLASRGEREALAALLTQTLRPLILFSLVASALMIALARPLVAVVFERGAFNAADTAATASVLVWFSVGIAAWSLQGVAARAFYAEQDTLTPMIPSTLMLFAALPAYWAVSDRYGAEGLALIASVGITLQGVITLALYRRRNPALECTPIAISAARGVGVAVASGVAAWGGRGHDLERVERGSAGEPLRPDGRRRRGSCDRRRVGRGP